MSWRRFISAGVLYTIIEFLNAKREGAKRDEEKGRGERPQSLSAPRFSVKYFLSLVLVDEEDRRSPFLWMLASCKSYNIYKSADILISLNFES